MWDNNDNRNLSDVFKELQQMQNTTQGTRFILHKTTKIKKNVNTNRTYYKDNDLKLSHIVVGCIILIIGLAVFFPKNVSFTQSYAKEEEIDEISVYELNRHRLNIQNIISENANMDRVKEQVTEERDIEFETEYNNNPSLPKSEEVVMREGTLGKENVTVVKTYENGNFVEEIILNKENILEPVSKIIDIGTSEFLAKHKVHIGDTMYLIKNANLKEATDDSSKDVYYYVVIEFKDTNKDQNDTDLAKNLKGTIEVSAA